MDTLIEIATQLGIDSTFYYLFVLVLVLYFLMSATYLRPFQKHLHHRKEKTDGVKKEAQELTGRAEEKFSQYKARLKDVNDQARQAMRENEETARREESKILADAGTKAKASLQSIQKELDTQKKITVEALSGEISGLATEIATKVMGRPAGTR